MEVLFLGTAAAEGYPAIFCDCTNCKTARALGGLNIRKRSACLVNDDLLIDFGPDISTGLQQHGRSLSKIKYLLITHAHDDHLLTSNLAYRRKKFCLDDGPARMEVHGSSPSIQKLQALPWDENDLNVAFHNVKAYDTWAMGPYHVTAFQAQHDTKLDPLFYLISDGEHSLLYATDTGPFFAETWNALADHRIDLAIIEGTLGNSRESKSEDHHMTMEQCVNHHRELQKRLIANPDCIRVSHHFSHNGNTSHRELVDFYSRHNILVAYDGMHISL